MTRLALALGLAFCASGLMPAPAAEDDVIVARRAPSTTLVWRANESVRELRAKHFPDAAFRDRLIDDAVARIRRFAQRTPDAHGPVAVRIVVMPQANDPRYRTATLSGVTTLGNVVLGAEAARKAGPYRPQATFDRTVIQALETP